MQGESTLADGLLIASLYVPVLDANSNAYVLSPEKKATFEFATLQERLYYLNLMTKPQFKRIRAVVREGYV
jgi:hypothetical protein